MDLTNDERRRARAVLRALSRDRVDARLRALGWNPVRVRGAMLGRAGAPWPSQLGMMWRLLMRKLAVMRGRAK